MTAVASAPQNATYCLQMPGGTKKSALVRGITVNDIEAGTVLLTSDKGNYRTDIPVNANEFNDISIRLPEGSKTVVRINKTTTKTPLSSIPQTSINIEVFTDGIDEVNCEGN